MRDILDRTSFTTLTSLVDSGLNASEFATVTPDAEAAVSSARIVCNISNGGLLMVGYSITRMVVKQAWSQTGRLPRCWANPVIKSSNFVIQA
jgi:hypothetical protein